MKIAFVTNFLYPEGLGGTELYCYQLANALIERGNEVYWFVPNFNSVSTLSEERGRGIKVVKFAAVDQTGKPVLNFITGSFTQEMKARDIRIAHFNEFGGDDGISTGLLEATKKAGIATIVTLHLVNYVCRSGTLHFGGTVPCNGKVNLSRCSSCYLFSDAGSSTALNLGMARLFDNVFKIPGIKTLPKIKSLMNGINLKSIFISSISEYADRIVTLTEWFRDVLLINGTPVNKIIYIPQVSPEIREGMPTVEKESRNGYVFVGRVNKEKGVDLLLDIAIKLKTHLPGVVIDLYGPYTPTEVLPHTQISNLNNFDNIHYKGVLRLDEVLPVMSKYKAVILPSRVAEMAPLIIMEANKLKVPVIASDVPGSAELVRQYDCGLIFKYRSAEDLYKKISEIESDMHEFTFKQPAENEFYHVAKKYEEVYKSCITQANAG